MTLLDAGLPELMTQWPAGSFQQFLLTHYHMDHVQGLFPLRWGVGEPIAVYGPRMNRAAMIRLSILACWISAIPSNPL